MYKKTLIGFLIVVCFLAFERVSFAQGIPNTTIFNPYGSDYREPKIYGEDIIQPPAPTPLPPAQQINVPVNNTVPIYTTTENTAIIESPIKTENFFSKLTAQKLKIDVHGIGKACQAGNTRPVPWTLVDNGVGIDTKEELLIVLNQALSSDYRIRSISIRENILEIDYLAPARLFGIIPINYLFKTKTDISTFTVHVEDPRWLSFGASYHAQVAQTLSAGLSQIYTPKNMEYISKQNNFYKHAFATAATSAIMTPIDVYPFANTFWICVIVPFFVLFLILLGLLFGFVVYLLAKRRRERYVRKFTQAHSEYERPTSRHNPSHSTPVGRNEDHDDESLDDYIASKRFK